LIEAHIDHAQECKTLINDKILEFLRVHAGCLQAMNMKIVEINDEVQAFISHEKCIKSSEFLRLVS